MNNQKKNELYEKIQSDIQLSSRYQLISTIGQGCFGKIFKVIQKKSNSQRALKVEKFQRLRMQQTTKSQIEILKKLKGRQGVPIMYNYGKWKYGMFIEMELLEHDFNRNIKLDQPTIIQMTLEMIKIMNDIHDCNIIHRDLKPHNIMKDANGKYYLIDYGLSKEILPSSRVQRVNGFIGTPRYASVRSHNHLEQSKKDDLESLFYVIAYMYYRKLPWHKLNIPNDKKMDRIKTLKVKHWDSLFKDMPAMFSQAFEYITNLEHQEEPNYKFLKNLFKKQISSIKNMPSLNLCQRQNKKKISLNMSNFLQVPSFENRFKKPQPNLSSRSNNSSKSILSGGQSFSNAVIIAFDDSWMQKDDRQNLQQDICCQPNLPDISKFMKNMTIKNPFA